MPAGQQLSSHARAGEGAGGPAATAIFAFLGGVNTLDNRERYQAFLDVLAENGIPFHPESYLTGDYREKSGYQAAKLLLIGERLPQALVCANDNMAIGAMRAFREAGVRIPRRRGCDGL